MSDFYRDVLDFHRKFGCAIGTVPSVPSNETRTLRLNLVTEEFRELALALRDGDLPGVADGSVDLIYVVLGTLASYGIDPGPIWAAVHAANMAKEGGSKRPDGKVLKPWGWTPPDIAGLLAAQPPLDLKDDDRYARMVRSTMNPT